MPITIHEGILDYMQLSENESQTGYSTLKKAGELGWYSIWKMTKESIVRKYFPVNKGIVEFPCSLESLLGIYVVDKYGDLAALYEDNQKNIIPKPKPGCSCNKCDEDECMCPKVQDSIVQIPVTINDQSYTNKIHRRLLKNGNVVEEKFTWAAEYNKDGSFKKATEVAEQRTICSVDTLPCGCPENTEENAKKLFACGCVCDWDIPALREKYPALYNDFGYYKKDPDKRQAVIFDTCGKKDKTLAFVILVYQSNGEDMLIPDFARLAFYAKLKHIRTMFSDLFTAQDEDRARRRYSRLELDMLKHIHPIPYEVIHGVGPRDVVKRPFYNGVHSDFKQQPAAVTQPPMPTQNITNIFESITAGAGKFKKVVGVGDGPVAGLSTYTHAALIGLGNFSGGEVDIRVAKNDLYNWGTFPDFDFDPATGQITLLNGNTWQKDDPVIADLNQ